MRQPVAKGSSWRAGPQTKRTALAKHTPVETEALSSFHSAAAKYERVAARFPGTGSIYKMYRPQVEAANTLLDAAATVVQARGGRVDIRGDRRYGRVLVLDENDPVMGQFVRTTKERYGATVIFAPEHNIANGHHAAFDPKSRVMLLDHESILQYNGTTHHELTHAQDHATAEKGITTPAHGSRDYSFSEIGAYIKGNIAMPAARLQQAKGDPADVARYRKEIQVGVDRASKYVKDRLESGERRLADAEKHDTYAWNRLGGGKNVMLQSDRREDRYEIPIPGGEPAGHDRVGQARVKWQVLSSMKQRVEIDKKLAVQLEKVKSALADPSSNATLVTESKNLAKLYAASMKNYVDPRVEGSGH